jgi:hypothetical protein
MNKTNQIPYTWDQIERQVRDAILCQLSILDCLGPNEPQLTRHYIGMDPELLDEVDLTAGYGGAAPITFPLERHNLHQLARNAYAYAYQLDGWERASPENHYEVVCAVMTGFPQTDMHGNPSPLSSADDQPLRRMFETFVARWQLYELPAAGGLSVRELALLSNMTVPAVRTSLSKEGFKLDTQSRSDGGRRDDDRSATLDVDSALLWLSRRRGFIPNRVDKPLPDAVEIAAFFGQPDLGFDQALRKAVLATRREPEEFADEISVTAQWLHALVNGEDAAIDVPALRALARALGVYEAEFVAKAVHHLIERDMTRLGQAGR